MAIDPTVAAPVAAPSTLSSLGNGLSSAWSCIATKSIAIKDVAWPVIRQFGIAFGHFMKDKSIWLANHAVTIGGIAKDFLMANPIPFAAAAIGISILAIGIIIGRGCAPGNKPAQPEAPQPEPAQQPAANQ